MAGTIKNFMLMLNEQPWLNIRKAIWIVLGGWLLFLEYFLFGIAFILTLIFIPFGIEAIKFSLFAFQPLDKESFNKESPHFTLHGHPTRNPLHLYTLIGNVLWLCTAGLVIAATHLALALVQALTIVGIGNAVQHVKLALFALWPFGRGTRRKILPTRDYPYPRQTTTASTTVTAGGTGTTGMTGSTV